MKRWNWLPLMITFSMPSVAIAQFSGAVSGGSELSQFFRAAQSTRVDVVGIGDSNQLFQGNGWDHGWILAVHERLGTHSTSLLSLGEGGGNSAGSGVGYRILPTFSQGTFLYDGAGPIYDDFLTPGIEMEPLNYLFVPAEQSATLLNHGLAIDSQSIIPSTEPLRFHLTYAVFKDTSSSFRPVVRLGQPPYTVLTESPPLSTQGSPAIASASIEFPGTDSPAAIQFMIGRYNSTLNGPFVGYTVRAERRKVTNGGSFSTLYGYGGQSTRDMAAAFNEASHHYLYAYFNQIRERQGEEKFVLVRINSGLNDRFEDLPPVDGSDAPPNSPQAYAANLQALLNRIVAVWSEAGWDQSELHFLITPPHPVALPDQQVLIDMRQAARDVAAGYHRCAVLDFTALTDSDEMRQKGWYRRGGSDRNHLTQPGYEALALRELDALLTYTSCPDIDGDGIVGLSDLNVILANFGQPSAAADLTGDGIIDLQDLNALLQAFGSSCAASAQD